MEVDCYITEHYDEASLFATKIGRENLINITESTPYINVWYWKTKETSYDSLDPWG